MDSIQISKEKLRLQDELDLAIKIDHEAERVHFNTTFKVDCFKRLIDKLENDPVLYFELKEHGSNDEVIMNKIIAS